jgi:hypothetical protein
VDVDRAAKAFEQDQVGALLALPKPLALLGAEHDDAVASEVKCWSSAIRPVPDHAGLRQAVDLLLLQTEEIVQDLDIVLAEQRGVPSSETVDTSISERDRWQPVTTGNGMGQRFVEAERGDLRMIHHRARIRDSACRDAPRNESLNEIIEITLAGPALQFVIDDIVVVMAPLHCGKLLISGP